MSETGKEHAIEVKTKYIASWSGGKDSMATIILAHENKEPLDLIIFSEVMFNEELSGELPEHIDFVKNKCIPLFNKWGYKVKILHSKETYMSCFNRITKQSKVPERNGKRCGFPIYHFAQRGGCWFCPNARDCELRHLRNNHPELWGKLLNLEKEEGLVGNMWNTLTKTRISDIEERYYWEQAQMSIFDFI